MATAHIDSDKPIEHVVRAFVIAPLVAVVAAIIPLDLYLLTAFNSVDASFFGSALLVLIYGVIIGVPMAYALTVSVCLPVYAVLRRNDALSLATVALSAVAISLAATVVVLGLIFHEPAGAIVLPSMLMTFAGVVGALAFWRIAFGERQG